MEVRWDQRDREWGEEKTLFEKGSKVEKKVEKELMMFVLNLSIFLFNLIKRRKNVTTITDIMIQITLLYFARDFPLTFDMV